MNNTYATISKDREHSDFTECFLWLLFPILIYSRNEAVTIKCSKSKQFKKWAYKFDLHCIENQSLKICEEIKLEVHCNVTGKTIFTQLPPVNQRPIN